LKPLHNLCDAAQGTATGLVNTGQQLLATSRQLNPQLQQLTAMSETSKQLRAQAERLKQLATVVLPQHTEHKQQQQQQ
jgi:cell shape-determining protein MreC